MLAGTLVTAIGFMPVGFARSTAGEYAGNMFWIVGIRLDRILDRRGGLHALSWREVAAEDQDGSRAGMRRSTTRRLQPFPPRARLGGSPQMAGRGCGGRGVLVAVSGMGVVKKQFFPTSDRPGGAGRSADAVWARRIEADERRRRQGRGLAGEAAGSQDRYRLHRPGRAALLSRHVAGATRSLVREDRRIDGRARRHAKHSSSGCVRPWPTAWRRKRACALRNSSSVPTRPSRWRSG